MPKPEVDELFSQRRWGRTGAAHEVGVRAARYLRATSRDRERLGGLLRVAVQKWAPYQGTPIDTEGASADDSVYLISAEKFCGVLAEVLEQFLGSSEVSTGPVPSALRTWQLEMSRPLRDASFRLLFGRSTLGANVFYCREPYRAVACLESLGEYGAVSSTMFSNYSLSIPFAGGGLIRNEALYFMGLRGARIVGFRALRYFLAATGREAPPRFLAERRMPAREPLPAEPWTLPQDSEEAYERAGQIMAGNGNDVAAIAKAIDFERPEEVSWPVKVPDPPRPDQ